MGRRGGGEIVGDDRVRARRTARLADAYADARAHQQLPESCATRPVHTVMIDQPMIESEMMLRRLLRSISQEMRKSHE